MQNIVDSITTACPTVTSPKTRAAYEAMYSNSSLSTCVNGLSAQRDALKQLDGLVSSLLELRYYRHIRRFAQQAERPLCVDTLKALAYVFYSGVALVIIMTLFTILAVRMATVKDKAEEDV